MRRRLWIGGLAVVLASTLASALAAESRLVPFEIKDQFDRVHTDQELAGRAAVIVISDRVGSSYSGAWERELAAALARAGAADDVRIVPAAHLRGVPFFVRGTVKRSFSQDESSPVLLDWKGAIAKAYGFEKDHCNLLAFDGDGQLVEQMAMTDFDPDALDTLMAKLGVSSAP